MKKITVFLLMLSVCLVPKGTYAKSYDASQLPIVTRNVPEWSNEYLTVINNWKGMFVKSVSGDLPPILSVITSINGKNAKGMSEEDFNDLMMSQDKSTIEYMTKSKGANVKKQCTIKYNKSIYWAEGITMTDPDLFPENIAMRNIKNASAFDFCTFSFQIGNVSEFDEANVLEAAGKSLSQFGFAKAEDGNHSDMVLSLSWGKDEYNGNKVTLNILDGDRLREGVERVLWALDVSDLSGTTKNQETAIKTALNRYCGNFPFDQPVYSLSITTLGIAFANEQSVSTGKVLEVLKNSNAYEKGLRGGNAILGAYAGYNSNLYWTQTRRYYFKPNRRDRQKNWGVDLLLILPIVPQFTYNNANHYLIDNKLRGGMNSRNHFKVKDNYGKKITMYAPFKMSTFNFKYIR